jgi:hypothetical protein
MPTSRLCALGAIFTTSLAAQQVIDTFSYPNGPSIPGWTSRTSTTAVWSVTNGRLVKSGGSTNDYLTLDGVTAKNCVVDLEVYYGGSGVQYGGLTVRHPGTSASSPLLYCKLQDNGAAADLDRVFIYENGGAGQTYADVGAGVTAGNIRLVVLDNQVTMLIDKDMNGVFDQTVPGKPLTAVLGAGMVGVSTYQATQIDNFKYYDGVLAEQSPPKIGTTYNVRFATPAPQYTPWLAGFSLTNSGLPFGNRAIPLGADALLGLTLGNAGALGLAGITDVNGDGMLAFPIPNNPALVGFAFFAAAITIDGTKPFTLGTISQDLRVVVQS